MDRGADAEHEISPQIQDLARKRIGSILRGKYRLDAVLGVGGMAVVYRATHRNQAEYAIKMLLPQHSTNEATRRRFLREGYAANSVKHPGIVQVVDDDVSEDGAAFLVLELLDGMACDKLAARAGGRLPLDAVCTVALQVLDVLEAAHAKGVVHRDIKPANLFVLPDGAIKVLDFGIARVRESMATGVHTTGGGTLLGTPAFMAPEQALGKTSDIDARVDVWALGATVFALASGVTVHESESAQGMLVQLVTRPARSLASVVPAAPQGIVDVIDHALLLDRDRRWPSARAMRVALEHAAREAFGEPLSRASLATQLRIASARPSALGEEAGPPSQEAGSQWRGPTAMDWPAAALDPTLQEAAAKAESLASRPVSRDDVRAQRPPRRRSILVAGALAVLGALISTVVLVVGGGGGAAQHDSGTAIRAAPLPIEESPVGPPPEQSVQQAPEAAALPTPSKSEGLLRAPPRAAPSSASTPPSHDAARQAVGSASEAPWPAEHRDAAPGCTPPFYYDSEHNRVFKKECL